jgi:hypothetical protein
VNMDEIRKPVGPTISWIYRVYADYMIAEAAVTRIKLNAGMMRVSASCFSCVVDYLELLHPSQHSALGLRVLADVCAYRDSFQSGRIAPDTLLNAPSTSSATSRRLESTGPGIVARPLGINLKPTRP